MAKFNIFVATFVLFTILLGVTSIPLNPGTITVTSPLSGAVWKVGSYQEITWKEKFPNYPIADDTSKVTVEIWYVSSSTGGTKADTVADGIPFGTGVATYEVPEKLAECEKVQFFYANVTITEGTGCESYGVSQGFFVEE